MPAHRANTVDRAVFLVTPHEAGWAVEFEGQTFDPSRDKQEAIAAAHRRARACHDGGRAAQVNISGEISFADRRTIVRPRTAEAADAAALPLA